MCLGYSCNIFDLFWLICSADLPKQGSFACCLRKQSYIRDTGMASVLLPVVAIFRNWTYAMFYMFAELWGSIVVSLLFWGFANEINTVDEAKKYYPLFGLIANVALIFSGQYVKFVSKLRGNLATGVDAWGFSLRLLMAAVVTGGVSVLSLFEFLQRSVIPDPTASHHRSVTPVVLRRKTKMTLGESAILAKSYIFATWHCLLLATGCRSYRGSHLEK